MQNSYFFTDGVPTFGLRCEYLEGTQNGVTVAI
jgi:hypothetical protein